MDSSSQYDENPATQAVQPPAVGTVTVANREPLTILRVATDLYPDITGGGAIHAHAMSKQQAANGHSVTVLTSDHGKPDRPATEHVDGYQLCRYRERARPFGNSITPGLISAFRKRVDDADVVHIHSHLYFSSNVTAALAQFSETPVVLTNHGLFSQTAPQWVQQLFIPTVARATFRAADRVLCYTETDRQRLMDRRITTPISVIDNGIDCEQFTPPATNHRPQQLLFVGRLTEAKGLSILLEAVSRLAESYPDLTLRVVGDGPKRAAFETECRDLGIDHRVTFVGDVAYEEMPQQYRESRLFVLPSRNEGLPRTVLEAMACETPVVTTALPQLEPVVDGAGKTVDPRTAAGFVEAIESLVTDEETCAAMGARGRQRVQAENSWTETVERTTAVYYDLQ